MQKRIATTSLLAVCLAFGAGVPAALAAPPIVPRPAATQAVAKPEARPSAPADRDADAARYAQAERAQPAAADFEGGATVVIVGSTTAVVLGIVLLLILL